ncbi:YceD family protein [Bifidobacterium simiarum]|uniref:YceD family protein n=1 Tax=Bifidobacterium simiarum TaxID=2045441 RepID=UPI001BDD7C38|nr:DUF177 domain-containing protein [Bifidobacterium simiarum]MBT1166449.1 DUF177 domain-containing protein [Bifidobacterium simiarum]
MADTTGIRPEESPWAISVAQIATRPGQSKEIDADFPEPSGIGDEVFDIRKGEPVHVSGSIDSIVDGLLLNATISAPYVGECSRCLKELTGELNVPVTAFFPYAPDEHKRNRHDDEEVEIIAGEEEGGDTYPLAGGNTFMDIEALLRDNLAEAMPLQPLCRPDCRGLCPQCGVDLNEQPDHEHETTDIRWGALEALKQQLESEQQ